MTKRRRRRGRRRKRGFASWSLGKKIGIVFAGTLLTVLAAGLGIVASKMGKIETTKLNADKLNISEEVEHETGYVNIALFGLDSREGDMGKGNRSDTIMIASLNKATKEVKLVSIYRDTLLQLDDGSYNKANSAYSFYGPEGAVSLLNKNLDMNIEKYVSVNFNALVDVIDAIDGIDMDLTQEEVCHMNNYCVETSKVTGKDYTRIEPEMAGTYHLNGVQAVSYARIRATSGGDFERASRQQLVLNKIAEKAQTMSISTINKIVDKVFPQVSTNFTLTEMIGYAKDFAKYKLGESLGFPSVNSTDTLNEVGSVVIPKSLSVNVLEVHRFLFGNDGYVTSGTVQKIESGIQARALDRATENSGTYLEEEYEGTVNSGNGYNTGGTTSGEDTASGTTGNAGWVGDGTDGTTGGGTGGDTGGTGGGTGGDTGGGTGDTGGDTSGGTGSDGTGSGTVTP